MVTALPHLVGTAGLWGDLLDNVVADLGQCHCSEMHTVTVGVTGGKQLLRAALGSSGCVPRLLLFAPFWVNPRPWTVTCQCPLLVSLLNIGIMAALKEQVLPKD